MHYAGTHMPQIAHTT